MLKWWPDHVLLIISTLWAQPRNLGVFLKKVHISVIYHWVVDECTNIKARKLFFFCMCGLGILFDKISTSNYLQIDHILWVWDPLNNRYYKIFWLKGLTPIKYGLFVNSWMLKFCQNIYLVDIVLLPPTYIFFYCGWRWKMTQSFPFIIRS